MTTGTKVFLAVFALLVALLVMYYGVLGPTGDPSLPVDDSAGAVVTSDVPPPPPSAARSTEPKRLQPDRPPPSSQPPVTSSPQPLSDEKVDPGALPDQARVALRQLEDDIARAAGAPSAPSAVGARTVGAPTPAGLAKGDDPAPEPKPRPESPASLPPTRYTDYVIKRGDTMTSIAEWWFGDRDYWDLIAQANPFVDPHAMKIGTTLRLPPKDTRRTGPAVALGKPGGVYIVQSGDTLSDIARARLGNPDRWREIYQVNRTVIGDDPNRLEVGMRLTIPASSGSARVTNASGGS